MKRPPSQLNCSLLVNLVLSVENYSISCLGMYPNGGQHSNVVGSALSTNIVNDEAYAANQTHINQLQSVLDNFKTENEQNHRSFTELKKELAQRVQEGEMAKLDHLPFESNTLY